MSTQSRDETDDRQYGVDGECGPRYAHLRLGEGDVIIYDRTNENAWLQTDAVVGLELMC